MRRALFALTVIMGACATLSVGTYLQPGANIASHQTFTWGHPDDIPTGDPRLDNNTVFQHLMRTAIERELTSRGYREVTQNADIHVHYHATVQQKTMVHRTDAAQGYRDYDEQIVQYEEGTLVIDLADVRTKQLLWRGWATDVVGGFLGKQADMERHVDKAVKGVFAGFPNAEAGPVTGR
jgi:hypothetical protein